jgi:hypothetical protein
MYTDPASDAAGAGRNGWHRHELRLLCRITRTRYTHERSSSHVFYAHPPPTNVSRGVKLTGELVDLIP